MPVKPYPIPESKPATARKSVIAYKERTPCADDRDPNIPFRGTQEEWWARFHCIEQGEFMTIEEADMEFEIWKKELLASRM